MTRTIRYFWCILGMLIIWFPLSGSVMAQTDPAQDSKELPSSEDVAKKETAQKELKDKAGLLVSAVVEQTHLLRLAENRVFAQTIAADLLWERDKEQARNVFADVMNQLIPIVSSCVTDESEKELREYLCFQVYQETVQKIATHDPKLAYELLRTTRGAAFPTPSQERTNLLNQLELGLITQMAGDDPKQLLQLAEGYLAEKGVSYQMFSLLTNLQSKDEKAATRLAGEIVKKLNADDIIGKPELLYSMLELLKMTSQPKDQAHPAISLEEDARRNLISKLVQMAVNNSLNSVSFLETGPNLFIIRELRSVMPEVAKYAPSQVPALRAKIAEYDKLFGGIEKLQSNYEKMWEKGTVDSLLEAGSHAQGGGEQFYEMAVQKALNDGDINRARQIVSEKFSDPEKRKRMTELIDQQTLSKAVEEGNINDARPLLSKARSKEDRIMLLARLAKDAAAKNNKKTAGELLEEARNLIGRRPTSSAQFQALLEVAKTYAELDPTQGLDLVEPLASQVNELVAAMATLDGFISYSGMELRDGEFILYNRGGRAMSLVTQWTETMALFARTDFDRVKTAIEQIQRDEFRTLTQLMIAQSLLSDSSNPDKAGKEPDQKSGKTETKKPPKQP